MMMMRRRRMMTVMMVMMMVMMMMMMMMMNTMMQPQQTKPLEMHSSPCTNPPPTPLRPECPKSQLLRPPATNTTATASMKRPATQRASAPDTTRSWRRAGPAGGGAPGGRGGREGGKTRWESR